MGILSRTGDLVYTLRFLRLLTTKWEDTSAFKLGLIDDNGKKLKSPSIDAEKSAYNTFHRLVFSLKRLLNKAPGGKSIKEELNLGEGAVEKIAEECALDVLEGLNEDVAWFRAKDGMLSHGMYKLANPKVSNKTFEEVCKKGDNVQISKDAYPVGNVLGQDIFEATHVRTGQQIYVAVGELRR
jgi:hypothetical protein